MLYLAAQAELDLAESPNTDAGGDAGDQATPCDGLNLDQFGEPLEGEALLAAYFAGLDSFPVDGPWARGVYSPL